MTQFFVLDLGDRLVNLNKIGGTPRMSAVELELDHAAVLDVEDGVIVRERDFNDWPAGLEAAGLDPALLGRLEAMSPGTTLVLES